MRGTVRRWQLRVSGDKLQQQSEIHGRHRDVGCERSDGHGAALLGRHLRTVHDLLRLQWGHLGVGHFEREDDVLHVSAAVSPGSDAGTCRCSGADAQPGRFSGATSFNEDIAEWDTSRVTAMSYM